jgi:ATP-dependent protease ClpP protease subunit
MQTITLNGTVVPDNDVWFYDWLEMSCIAPSKVRDSLANAGGDAIEVLINSGGGDVFSGSEVYTLIKEYAGTVKVKITGIAASAASIIAMAGDEVAISPTASMMIHNISAVGWGDKNAHAKLAGDLERLTAGIAKAYELKTGKPLNEILNDMDEETWFNAEQAVEYGLCDEVLYAEQNTPVQLVANASGMISSAKIAELKMKLAENHAQNVSEPLSEETKAFIHESVENVVSAYLSEMTAKQTAVEPPKNETSGFSKYIY